MQFKIHVQQGKLKDKGEKPLWTWLVIYTAIHFSYKIQMS